jgi:hypothetical protein
MGSCGEDTRQMTHSRKSATQRQKSLEGLRMFRDRKVEEPMAAVRPVRLVRPAPPAPPPPNPFDAAYSGHPITPEAAYWGDSGYMRWTLDTCQAGSRLSHSRNRANPTT